MRKGEGFADPSRSNGADSADLRELGVSRLDNGGDAAEVSQQSPSRHCRDARERREHRFRGRRLRPLRIERSIARTTTPGGAAGDAVEPEGRVRLTLASYDCHAVLAGGEQCAPDRCRRERTCVERLPFDEEIRRASCCAKAAELSPKAAGRECEVAHGLSLHERAVRSVVPDKQSEPLHVGAEPAKLVVDGFRLVHVHVDANHLDSHCAYRSREARTT